MTMNGGREEKRGDNHSHLIEPISERLNPSDGKGEDVKMFINSPSIKRKFIQ